MNPTVLIWVCLWILVSLVVAVTVAVAAARSWRKLRARRRAALSDPLRTPLIQLAIGDADQSLVDHFVGLPDREWRSVLTQMLDLCRKLDVDSTASLRSAMVERGVLDQAIHATRRRSPVRRARAAMVLELFPTSESRTALLGLLADRDRDVRRMAVRGIGAIGDAACVRPLIAMLHGPNAVAASSVGHSLILLGSIAVDDVVDAVRSHQEESVVASCVQVLGHLGDQRAAPCLVGALCATNPHRPDVRLAAARALGRLGSPKGIGALIEGLGGDSNELTVACIEALAAVGSADAIPAIAARLSSSDASVATAASAAIPRFGVAGVEAMHSMVSANDLAGVDPLGPNWLVPRDGPRTRVRVGA